MAESIAILGGTGKEGRGLAARWARAGREVLIGSRDAARAAAAAAEMAASAGGRLSGATNLEVASAADVAVLATPFDGMAETVAACADALQGRVVVSTVVPLQVRAGEFSLRQVPEGSAAEQAAARAPRARVAAGFHGISASVLADLDSELDEDVLFCGPDDTREVVGGLCADLGARGVYAGGLHLAAYLEGCTAVLLSVNRLYHGHAGLRVTGLPGPR